MFKILIKDVNAVWPCRPSLKMFSLFH